jgi:hypothetical protein
MESFGLMRGTSASIDAKKTRGRQQWKKLALYIKKARYITSTKMSMGGNSINAS